MIELRYEGERRSLATGETDAMVRGLSDLYAGAVEAAIGRDIDGAARLYDHARKVIESERQVVLDGRLVKAREDRTVAAADAELAVSLGIHFDHVGVFDYRPSGNMVTGHTQLRHFRNISNVNVRLFAQQAGFSLDQVLKISGEFAKHRSSNDRRIPQVHSPAAIARGQERNSQISAYVLGRRIQPLGRMQQGE